MNCEIIRRQLPERVVGYYNPASTKGEQAKGYLHYAGKELERAGTEFDMFATERSQTDMNESVAANVKVLDSIIVASGDGGSSSILEASLMHPEKPPVLVMPFGNGNDLASMLNSESWLSTSPVGIMGNVNIERFHPISVDTRTPDGEESLIRAFAYYGLGVTGRLNERLCDPEIRDELDRIGEQMGEGKRFSTEIKLAIRELRLDDPLIYKNGSQRKAVAGLNFINGRRESKTSVFPVRLLSDEIAVAEIENPSLKSALKTVAQAVTGRVVVFDSNHMYQFQVETDVRTQKDGQVFDFPAGTEFTVRRDPEHTFVYASEDFTALEYYRHKIKSII